MASRLVPVDHHDRLDRLAAVFLGDLHFHAVLQQFIDFLVGVDREQPGAITRELFDGLIDGVGWEGGIEPLECGAESALQHHVLLSQTALARDSA